ncbi:MAG: tetratricopeptide repeat protein [Chloroflexota bacterium]
MTAVRGRRSPRVIGLLAAALLVAGGSYLGPAIVGRFNGGGDGSTDAPRVVLSGPGAAATPVDGTSGDGRLPLAERIAFWSTRVQEQPSDYLSLVQLAVAWSEQGRLRLDLDALTRASQAVERALAIAPAYPSAIAVRASIRFTTHDFSGAEADARTVLRTTPDDPAALAVLGDSLLELGRIDEASATYEQLGALAGGPALDIRKARLAFVRGNGAAALDLARKALISASGGGAANAEIIDPAVLGFYHFALGEYARLTGTADLAEAEFRAAIELRPTDLGALLGLARVQAFDGDLDAAITSLESAAAIAPTPEAEAMLGDLQLARAASAGRSPEARAADRLAAETAYGTVRLTRTLSALAGAVFDRQLILFDLDHGAADDRTLDAARAAFVVRPDAAGRDLVAWALHRLGRDEEAAAESRAARATGAADARTLFHAGAIAAALGDRGEAGRLIDAALALGPGLDPIERAEATRIRATLDSGSASAP